MNQISAAFLIQALKAAFENMSSERGWYQDLKITKTGAGSIMNRYKKGNLSIEKMVELLDAKKVTINL